jgi:hypothetical protein
VAAHPLRERLRGQLMLALYHLGRQAEALQVYQRTYNALREELGIEPSPTLQRLHRAILAAEPALIRGPERLVLDRTASTIAAATVQVTETPHQVPAPPSHFVGRDEEVAQVAAGIWAAAKARRSVLAVISGAAGSGKTALALTVAQQVADAFPDGQLFVPMRSCDPTHYSTPAATAQDALAMMLRSIDRNLEALPKSPDELSALLRTALTDRRMLIVVDDVSSAAAVRPLLAAQPGCAVLVTGRPSLVGLDHEIRVTLGSLPKDPAVELLAKVVGGDRVAAEPAAAEDIVRLCDGLPLALRTAAARLAARPRWPLANFVRRLADPARRLDELAFGDLDVRSAIAGSYRRVGPAERTAFRALGQLELGECSAERLAKLLRTSVVGAEHLADRLVEAQLLEHRDPSPDDRHWYRMPNLTRLFAREKAKVGPREIQYQLSA